MRFALDRLLPRRSRRVDPASVGPREAMTPERLEGPLRIGYVAWDWPALSQTFVLNEIQELQSRGHDVVVYYAVPADQPAQVSFQVDTHQVADAAELERLVVEHDRQVMHSAFAYPSTTKLMWPAAQATGIPFTFMAGGVDVAHYDNMKRNRIDEVTASPECLGVITLGTFHRDLLLECGVPSQRIVMERQSAALPAFGETGSGSSRPRIISIGRFIEKKGLEFLVRAAPLLPEVDVVLYGFGPLEAELRALAEEVGASNVDFAGAIEGADALDSAYRGADAFVLPCVRAANGDLDGLPTVLLEAMGAGVPVVTTDAANIPDLVIDGATGFLCAQRDVESLAAAVRRALGLPDERRRALVRTARRQAEAYANPARTTDTLVRLWRRDSLDIVLVTFDREGYKSEADTVEIIERLIRFTSVPFSITVVDNDSDRSFVSRLTARFGQHPQVDIVALDQNVFCGPASNIGFGRGSANYLVYVCSNEGFVLRHGWDHQMIRVLERTGAAMGGFPVELNAFRTGSELEAYPSFEHWRSRQFAFDNPDRRFRHIQGGLFILRREAFEASGGFNPLVPQNGMDVEYSHHLESLGHTLAAIPGVVGISVKTRPPLLTLVDEFTVAVHPSRAASVGTLDDVVGRSVRMCPVCEWAGPAFDAAGGTDLCPSCGSNPFSRTAIRLLSQGGQLQRRPRTRIIGREASLRVALERLCPGIVVDVADDATTAADLVAAAATEPPGLLVVDRFWATPDEFEAIAPALGSLASQGVLVVVGAPWGAEVETVSGLVGPAAGADVTVAVLDLVSGVCSFDPYPVAVLGAPWDDGPMQGIEC